MSILLADPPLGEENCTALLLGGGLFSLLSVDRSASELFFFWLKTSFSGPPPPLGWLPRWTIQSPLFLQPRKRLACLLLPNRVRMAVLPLLFAWLANRLGLIFRRGRPPPFVVGRCQADDQTCLALGRGPLVTKALEEVAIFCPRLISFPVSLSLPLLSMHLGIPKRQLRVIYSHRLLPQGDAMATFILHPT